MSKKSKAEFANAELPIDVAAIAQQSVDQAQVAYTKANVIAQDNAEVLGAAAEIYKSGFADIQKKALAATQTNMSAIFAFAHKAFGVKDVSELLSLQQDFLRDQTASLQAQAKEFNDLSVALTKDTVKPVQDGIAKTVASFNKSFAA